MCHVLQCRACLLRAGATVKRLRLAVERLCVAETWHSTHPPVRLRVIAARRSHALARHARTAEERAAVTYTNVDIADGVATLCMSRGKVNALNPEMVGELRSTFDRLERAADVRAVVLTGTGAFFSFGFDVPEFLPYERARFEAYLQQFTGLYAQLYECPKPLVAALNGHAVAGGCMIAIACDHRVMADGKAKIGLNEVTFRASLFAGSLEILRALVGQRHAERIALSGELFTASDAARIGLVDEVCLPSATREAAVRAAVRLASNDPTAFADIKRLVRAPISARMRAAEPDSIHRFTDIWYSPSTRAQLERIVIR